LFAYLSAILWVLWDKHVNLSGCQENVREPNNLSLTDINVWPKTILVGLGRWSRQTIKTIGHMHGKKILGNLVWNKSLVLEKGGIPPWKSIFFNVSNYWFSSGGNSHFKKENEKEAITSLGGISHNFVFLHRAYSQYTQF